MAEKVLDPISQDDLAALISWSLPDSTGLGARMLTAIESLLDQRDQALARVAALEAEVAALLSAITDYYESLALVADKPWLSLEANVGASLARMDVQSALYDIIAEHALAGAR